MNAIYIEYESQQKIGEHCWFCEKHVEFGIKEGALYGIGVEEFLVL